jgi:hypothetical protein
MKAQMKQACADAFTFFLFIAAGLSAVMFCVIVLLLVVRFLGLET